MRIGCYGTEKDYLDEISRSFRSFESLDVE
jgi:hypothetical protein